MELVPGKGILMDFHHQCRLFALQMFNKAFGDLEDEECLLVTKAVRKVHEKSNPNELSGKKEV